MTLNPPQDFRSIDKIHRVGLTAAKPAAADVLPGTLYFSTDTLTIERSNGTTWVTFGGSGGGSGGAGNINGSMGLDGIDGEAGEQGFPGEPGRSIQIYEQPNEPLGAKPGDFWIDS